MRNRAGRANTKTTGRSAISGLLPVEEGRPPERVSLVCLEFELHAQSDGRRVLEDRARAEERVTNVWHAGHAAARELRGVLADCALSIGHIEPIELEAQFLALTDREWVVGAEVEVISPRRTVTAGDRVDRSAAGHGETFIVAIHRMRAQRIERDARVGAERRAG